MVDDQLERSLNQHLNWAVYHFTAENVAFSRWLEAIKRGGNNIRIMIITILWWRRYMKLIQVFISLSTGAAIQLSSPRIMTESEEEMISIEQKL